MTNTMQSGTQGETDTVAAVASTAKAQASDVASSAGEEAKAVAHDAAEHARQLVGETRSQLRAQASEQTGRVTETLRDMSEQLRAMSDGHGAAPGMVSDLTAQLASTTGRFATRLDEGGVDAALGEVKRFARNRPGLFLVAAAGAGFAAARLLKAADTHALSEAFSAADDSAPNDRGSSGQASMSSPSAYGSVGGGGTMLASDPIVVEP